MYILYHIFQIKTKEGNNEKNALSFTDDGGETWKITSPSGKSEKVYNLYANENRIWAATASGLYVSEDGNQLPSFPRFFSIFQQKHIQDRMHHTPKL